ncbi:MAG: hypothetical protein V8S95_03550, partial [Odoribacter sp.]
QGGNAYIFCGCMPERKLSSHPNLTCGFNAAALQKRKEFCHIAVGLALRFPSPVLFFNQFSLLFLIASSPRLSLGFDQGAIRISSSWPICISPQR